MSDRSKKGNPSGSSERKSNPATPAQVLRQAVAIIIVVTLWSILLVGYLALTGAGEEQAATTPLPTETMSAAATAAEPSTPEPEAAQPLPEPASEEAVLPSFSADVLPIFEQHCQRCHGTARTDAGLSLSSHTGVMAGSRSGAVVILGSAADSDLVQVIVTGRMPRGAAKLSEVEIQTISDWVDAGAPDN